ncbi:MAG: hypothetical protein J0L82_17425 [Deltaproteobacteria bacterium]|nr:hypothetical protein [Deltaproteobacteria bacterium]
MKKQFWIASVAIATIGLATVLLLPQFKQQQLKSDLNLLCSAHERAEVSMKEKGIDRIDPEITVKMWTEIEAGMKHPDMILAVRAIANASPEIKYSLYQQAAAESGQPGWECPAVQRLIGL